MRISWENLRRRFREVGIFLVLLGAALTSALCIASFLRYPYSVEQVLIYQTTMGAVLVGALLLLASLVGATKEARSAVSPSSVGRTAWLATQFYRWMLLLAIVVAVCAHSILFLFAFLLSGIYDFFPVALQDLLFWLHIGSICLMLYVTPVTLVLLLIAWVTRSVLRHKTMSAAAPRDDKEP